MKETSARKLVGRPGYRKMLQGGVLVEWQENRMMLFETSFERQLPGRYSMSMNALTCLVLQVIQQALEGGR